MAVSYGLPPVKNLGVSIAVYVDTDRKVVIFFICMENMVSCHQSHRAMSGATLRKDGFMEL